MKQTELKNGQIIEEFESLKEAKQMIMDCFINNKDFLSDDDTLCIEYKDGSHYFMNMIEEEGIFKKTNIKTVMIDNGCTYQVFGEYELVKTDTEDDDEYCCWIVR